MPTKEKKKSFYPAMLTREAMRNYKAWPHLRILVILADNFMYFKENRVNKFEVNQLAELCGVRRAQVSRSLKYLRENHYLITIAGEEFVNPLYCFQCREENYKELLEYIVDEHKMYFNNELIIKPSYWPPRFKFKGLKSAKKGDKREDINNL